ncbi:uncharacterized protein isoform X3 [Castor canadensis]|uniref:Uncharacterized protein isoform X3 n=1 Tax=Castor canadensis TaxID=51338 RepID=A0AC58L3R9_CASCN
MILMISASWVAGQQPPSPRRDSGKDDNLVTDPGRERKRLGCRWLTLLSALLGSGSRSLRPGCGVQHIGGPVPGHEARVVPVARALLEEALTEVRADAAARRHQPEVAAATATGPGSATGRRAWRGPPAARPRVPRTSPPPPPPRRRGAEPQPHAPEPGRGQSRRLPRLNPSRPRCSRDTAAIFRSASVLAAGAAAPPPARPRPQPRPPRPHDGHL